MSGKQNPKEQAIAVAQIINEMKIKRELSDSKKNKSMHLRKMVGRSNYAIPNEKVLRETHQRFQSEKK